MSFAFHANLVYPDLLCRRLSFVDRDDETCEHYLIFDRSEEDADVPIADMANVYLERDDQGWGGFGGIESVTLSSGNMTFRLNPKMAKRMGGHSSLQVTFTSTNEQWETICSVVGLIMKGYEAKLVIHD